MVREAAPERRKADQPAAAAPEPRTSTESTLILAPPGPGGEEPVSVTRAPATAPAEPAPPVKPPGFNVGYLRNPAPQYPLAARRAGEQGTVLLRVLVTQDGVPAQVSIERSSGFARLDRAAVEAVRTWRFAPARRGADAVEAWVLVPVVFKLEGVS
jgi:protein TonB